MIMLYQSWDFENLSDVPLKSESRAKSRSRRRPPWLSDVHVAQWKGECKGHTHPLGFLSQRFISSRISPLNVWTFKMQCFPRSSPTALLGLTPAVPSTPACTPKYHLQPLPLLLPEPTIHCALLCHVVHAVRSTHVSFLPLPAKTLLTLASSPGAAAPHDIYKALPHCLPTQAE